MYCPGINLKFMYCPRGEDLRSQQVGRVHDTAVRDQRDPRAAPGDLRVALHNSPHLSH